MDTPSLVSELRDATAGVFHAASGSAGPAVLFVHRYSANDFRILTEGGWCDCDHEQAAKIIENWQRNHNL